MANHLLFVLKRTDVNEFVNGPKDLPWGGWTPVNPYGMSRPTYGIPRDPRVLEAIHAFRSESDAWMYLFGVHADGTDELSEAHRRAMRLAWKVVALEEITDG